MEQQIFHETESLEGYVPDVICPMCKATVHLHRSTFEYYDDETGCYECKATFTVRIGFEGFAETPAGRLFYRTTSRPAPGIPGGMLLEAPKVVIPAHLTGWVSSIGDNVPTQTRDEYLRAVTEYGRLNFSDAALHFRTTLEYALGELGVIPANVRSLNRKIGIALRQNAISEETASLCRVVAMYGNRSAHAQPDPTMMVNEPLAYVSMTLTRDILKTLFPG